MRDQRGSSGLQDRRGSAWVVLVVGDGFWSWVWVVLGLLVDWMGLLMCWVYLPWVMGLLAMGDRFACHGSC